jgi:hypothetical protein
MADEKHLRLLRSGADSWNEWRREFPDILPDLYGAHLEGENLYSCDLYGANLSRANLKGADLCEADLSGARMIGSVLHGADLRFANLNGAFLFRAELNGAKLRGVQLQDCDLKEACLEGAELAHSRLDGANLAQADLKGADLTGASMRGVNLSRSDVSGCAIFGAAILPASEEDMSQLDLTISAPGTARITVDGLSFAQFVSAFLYNEAVWSCVDALSARTVAMVGSSDFHASSAGRRLAEAVRGRGRKCTRCFTDGNSDSEVCRRLFSLAELVLSPAQEPQTPLPLLLPRGRTLFVPALENGTDSEIKALSGFESRLRARLQP